MQTFIHQIPELTPREREILALASDGKNDTEIGDLLGLERMTISYLMRGIMTKMRVTCRIAAVAKAIREGLIA